MSTIEKDYFKKRLNKCKSEPDIGLTAEDVYNLRSKPTFGFLEGYEIPRQYFDYRACIWNKRRQEIKAEHKSPWPPTDWKEDKDGKKKPPQKTNFIDDQIQWAKSFVNEERAKKILEDLSAKGKEIKEYYPSPWNIKPGPNLKEKFLREEKEKQEAIKKKEAVPEYKEQAYEQVKEKIKQAEESSKYTKRGRPTFSKCDRVTIVADAEYVGETIPFYKTPAPKEGEDSKNPKKLFYPSKIPIWNRAPIWSFNMRTKMGKEKEQTSNSYLKERDNLLNEKAEKALQKSGIDLKTYQEDPALSYEKVVKHGRLPYVIAKRFEYEKVQQYIDARTKTRDYTPGPDYYWDDGLSKNKARNNSSNGDEKKYIMTRDKTNKRVNIPYIRKYIF